MQGEPTGPDLNALLLLFLKILLSIALKFPIIKVKTVSLLHSAAWAFGAHSIDNFPATGIRMLGETCVGAGRFAYISLIRRTTSVLPRSERKKLAQGTDGICMVSNPRSHQLSYMFWEKGSMQVVSAHFRTQRFSNLIMPVNPPRNRVNMQILIDEVWDGAGDSVLLRSFWVTPMKMVWSRGHILNSKKSPLPLVQEGTGLAEKSITAS